MEKKQIYDVINSMIGDEVFQYEGPIMGGISLDVVIDFKFKIIGDVKLLHMGETTNYVGINVSVLSITPPSLDDFIPNLDNSFEIKDRMYFTATKLENRIWEVLRYFSIEDSPVITSIEFTGKRHRDNHMKNITEGTSERKGIVRKLVQDIIKVFKQGEGEYDIPEDISDEMTYSFRGLNTDFTMEVKIDEDENIDGFELDGGYYDDEDTFEIQIIYNPEFFPEKYYDLIGELNELVRHELQHLIQAERGIDRPTNETDPEKYYLQPHEIDAQVAGFKRLSKIRKQPFEKIVRDFFHKNKTLSNAAKERIVSALLIAKR